MADNTDIEDGWKKMWIGPLERLALTELALRYEMDEETMLNKIIRHAAMMEITTSELKEKHDNAKR